MRRSCRWWRPAGSAPCCGSCLPTSRGATTRPAPRSTLPPHFKRAADKLGTLFNALASHPPGRHCIEFRNPSWFTEEVYEQLRWHGVALVIGDRKGLDFQPHEIIGDWTFVRFHHGHRGHRGNYSQTELAEWAERID